MANSLRQRATEDSFWRRHPEIWPDPEDPEDPDPNYRVGLYLDRYGRRLPISLTSSIETDEFEPVEPFEPAETWAETIGRALKQRPPLTPPGLRPWTESLDLATLNRLRALLTVRHVSLASAAKTATSIRRLAESLASSFRVDDERKARQLSDDRAEAVLRGLLRLADDLQQIIRSDADRFRARRETVRVLPRSRRRTELLKLYASMLPDRLTLAERRRRDIVEIFAEASRCRSQPAPKLSWWWRPPDRLATKNKANSQAYAKIADQLGTYIVREQEHAALSASA